MDLRFGPLLKDDLPALLDLWVESWSHVYPGIRFDDRREWFDGHLVSNTMTLDVEGPIRYPDDAEGDF